VRIARQAFEEVGREGYVIGDIGPFGGLMEPYGEFTEEQVRNVRNAFRILYLPIGLFGVAIASASLPLMSQQAARGDMPALRQTLSHAVRLVLALTVPATFGLIALGVPIVRVIFERGHFLPTDTEAVALALMGYAPGLVGYSAVKVLSPTFYALRDSRTPVIVSVTSVLMNALLSVLLARSFEKSCNELVDAFVAREYWTLRALLPPVRRRIALRKLHRLCEVVNSTKILTVRPNRHPLDRLWPRSYRAGHMLFL